VIAGGLKSIERYRPILLIELHGPKHAHEVWDLLLEQRYQSKVYRSERGAKRDDRGSLATSRVFRIGRPLDATCHLALNSEFSNRLTSNKRMRSKHGGIRSGRHSRYGRRRFYGVSFSEVGY
jgi:hypothetical protein